MPENSAYYYAAYAVTIVCYAAYGVSVAMRRRALARRRDAAGRKAAA